MGKPVPRRGNRFLRFVPGFSGPALWTGLRLEFAAFVVRLELAARVAGLAAWVRGVGVRRELAAQFRGWVRGLVTPARISVLSLRFRPEFGPVLACRTSTRRAAWVVRPGFLRAGLLRPGSPGWVFRALSRRPSVGPGVAGPGVRCVRLRVLPRDSRGSAGLRRRSRRGRSPRSRNRRGRRSRRPRSPRPRSPRRRGLRSRHLRSQHPRSRRPCRRPRPEPRPCR